MIDPKQVVKEVERVLLENGCTLQSVEFKVPVGEMRSLYSFLACNGHSLRSLERGEVAGKIWGPSDLFAAARKIGDDK